MPRVIPKPDALSRARVIDLLRQELVKRAGDEISACRVAAEQGIFCRGFARYTDLELRRRYHWITRRYPNATRQELEELADRWQLARQIVHGKAVACDVQQSERDACRGWDDFTNEELARSYYEMTGKEIVVA